MILEWAIGFNGLVGPRVSEGFSPLTWFHKIKIDIPIGCHELGYKDCLSTTPLGLTTFRNMYIVGMTKNMNPPLNDIN